MTLKQLWLKISVENRKRIVSTLNTFVVTFLVLLSARLEVGFPDSWTAMGAVAVSLLRLASREALNYLVATLSEK